MKSRPEDNINEFEREGGRVNRRTLIATTAVAGAAGSLAIAGSSGTAQDTGVFMPATPVALGETMPPELVEFAADWPAPAGNLAGTRASAGSTIDSSNAATLGPAWRFELTGKSGYGAITSTSLVAGDTVYVQDMQSNFIALDRETGEVKWKTDFNVGTHGPNGLAIAYGRVFGSLGNTGEIAAVDLETGELIWRVQLTNHPGESITIAPTVYDNTVLVSTAPGNPGTPSGWYTGGTKGIIYALDASSGGTMWQWDTTTDNLWGDNRANSGGGAWYPIAVDDNGQLYFGVGNPGPFPGTPGNPNSESRPGNNLYTNCVVAFDPAEGKVRWHQQPRPRDLFDLDFQNTPVVTTITSYGEELPVVIASGKYGHVIAVHRETGNLIWNTLVGKHQNDLLEELPADEYIEVYPGFNGAVQAPIAVADGRVYVPVNNWPTWYNATGLDFSRIDESQSSGEFIALDANTGEVVWQHVTPALPLGAAAVANDVVISAGTDGIVRAYATEDGTEIWNFQLQAGVNAPVSIAGDMLLVGAGGPFMVKPGQFPDGAPEPVSELVAFKLGVGGGTVPDSGAASTPEVAEAAAETEAAAAITPEAGEDGVLAVTVEAYDLGYRQRSLAFPVDTDVAITFVNTGAIPHDFVIDEPAVNSGMLENNEQATFVVNLPAETYDYYCSVAGHRQAGMAGRIEVS